MIVTVAVWVGLFGIGVGVVLCALRILKGPSLFDRVMAFDCLALNLVGAMLLISIHFRTAFFMDVVLVVALLGFLGTISLAAYLEGSLVD
jgi:multisubunit Na+/H+ antiporter MnhF subunit